MSLARKSYGDVAKALENATDSELFELVDSPSIKIGDTAIGILSARDQFDLLAAKLRAKEFRTRNGKLRALSTIALRGRKYKLSQDLCIQYLEDRARDVAGEALHYLVLWNERELIPTLLACKNPLIQKEIPLAVRAIEKSDYTIYSPHLRIDDRWKKEANQSTTAQRASRVADC